MYAPENHGICRKFVKYRKNNLGQVNFKHSAESVRLAPNAEF